MLLFINRNDEGIGILGIVSSASWVNICFQGRINFEEFRNKLKDGKSSHEVEKVVEAMGRGEPVNSSGNAQ